MIDVSKELERYRSVFDVYCKKEKDHPNFKEAETVKFTYVLFNYKPGMTDNKLKDIHRVGEILGDFYKNRYLWKDHFDTDSLGSVENYTKNKNYKLI